MRTKGETNKKKQKMKEPEADSEMPHETVQYLHGVG